MFTIFQYPNPVDIHLSWQNETASGTFLSAVWSTVLTDLHIDIWQGVLPQNDIVKLQKQINGRMCLMGGIDAAIVDRDDSTEEEIRAETRRVCETYAVNGCFIPSITYGGAGCIHHSTDVFIDDEIEKCSNEFFGKK